MPTPSTETPRPFRVSYSQISQFKTCKLQWWFKSVGKYPEVKRAGAQLGGEVHRAIEAYLKGGGIQYGGDTNPRISSMLMAAVGQNLLPRPLEPNVYIEKHFTLHTPEGVPLIGSIDVLRLDRDNIRVIDHKTAKMKRYVKSEDELRADLQTSIYLMAARALAESEKLYKELPQNPTVQHIVYMTEGPIQVFPVGPVALSWSEVEDNWAAGVSHVPVMQALATEKTVPNVDGNRAACDGFGGCSYKDICPTYTGARQVFSQFNKTTQTQTGADMSTEIQRLPGETMVAYLKRKNEARLQGNPGVNPPAPEPKPEVKVQAAIETIAQAMQVQAPDLESIDPPDTQLPADTTPAPSLTSVQQPYANLVPVVESKDTLVDGKECKRIGPSMKASLKLLGFQEDEIKAMWPAAAQVILNSNTPRADVLLQADGMVRWQSEAARMRAFNQQVSSADREKQPSAPVVPEPNNTQDIPATPTETQATKPAPVFFLMVDCLPVGVDHIELGTFLLPAMKQVEEAKEVPLYSMMDFGQGPKLVASALLTPEFRIPDGAMVVLRGMPDWREPVLGILRRDPRCIEIVGLRG